MKARTMNFERAHNALVSALRPPNEWLNAMIFKIMKRALNVKDQIAIPLSDCQYLHPRMGRETLLRARIFFNLRARETLCQTFSSHQRHVTEGHVGGRMSATIHHVHSDPQDIRKQSAWSARPCANLQYRCLK